MHAGFPAVRPASAMVACGHLQLETTVFFRVKLFQGGDHVIQTQFLELFMGRHACFQVPAPFGIIFIQRQLAR
jgi:hypothetical protein